MAFGVVEAVERTLDEAGFVHGAESAGHIVCAVSGGPDSMALLHALHAIGGRRSLAVTAAHMNHGFRPLEAEREAELAASYCAAIGVPFVYGQADVPARARERGDNAQAAARELRYRFLTDTAVACGARAVALAHHADDQAETVLMNVVRGSGLSGLSGMPFIRKSDGLELIRPLLRISKEELVAYCRLHAVPFAVDSSNLQRKYTRNRIRLDAMPQLLSINPRLTQSLNRLADIVREEDALIERLCEARAQEIVAFSERSCRLSRIAFVAEPTALQRRLIKLILNYVAGDARFPDFSMIESFRTAINGNFPPSLVVEAGGGIRLKRTYDSIVITAEADEAAPATEAADAAAQSRIAVHFEDNPRVKAPAGRNEALFDAEHVSLPLTVRTRRDGDRIEPYGLNGSKKVKDMFIDLKISPALRDRIPVVVDALGRLLWVAGVRRSRHAPVTAATRRIVRLSYEPVDSDQA